MTLLMLLFFLLFKDSVLLRNLLLHWLCLLMCLSLCRLLSLLPLLFLGQALCRRLA